MKIKSALVTQLSGSIGGMTGYGGKTGLILRPRTMPVDPGTGAQVQVRNFMGQLASAWVSTLTDTQRTAWETYAGNVQVPGRLGDPQNLDPLPMFIRCNVPRLLNGYPQVDDAPVIFDLGTFTPPVITISAATGDMSVAFTAGDIWVGQDDAGMIVQASRQQNPTVNFFKGPYLTAGTVDGDLALPPSSPATIAAPFGVTQDNKVFVRTSVTYADGRLTTAVRDEVVVAA